MFGHRKNVYNSNVEKALEVNKAKKSIDYYDRKILEADKVKEKIENLKDTQNEIHINTGDQLTKAKEALTDIEKASQLVDRFTYLFSSKNNMVINSANSVIMSNTSTSKRTNNSPKKDATNVEKSLEILKNADFFETLNSQRSGEKLMTDTVELHHKHIRNLRASSSIPLMEKVYKNFMDLKEKDGALLIGFDLETVGDVTGKAWSPQGITEFAMVIDNMKTRKSKEINIALTSSDIGIDHNKNLKDIRKLLKLENGLELLKENKDLLIAAERYSMYGHKNSKIEFDPDLGYSRVTSFAGEDAKKIGNIDVIEKGVQKILEDSEKVKVNNRTGLKQDVSEVLRYAGFMAQQTQKQNAIAVNFNGQIFDTPVLNKFIKGVYQNQLNVLENSDPSSSEYKNATKATEYIQGLFGNSPSLDLNEDYVVDAFAFTRTANQMFGENQVYSQTDSGRQILPKVGNHANRQENIARAFYPNRFNSGTAHTAIHDTKVLLSFFLDNMEGAETNSPLINWIMEGINGEGIIGKTNKIKTNTVNPGQVFMATQSTQGGYNGKDVFNFIKDSNERIVTSSNHVIDSNGNITHHKILNENPRIEKGSFYSIKSAQKIDMSNITPELSQLAPQYGADSLYHVQLETIHGDKYKGTSNNSNVNLIFNSQKEMEAWISGLSLIGEPGEDGKFKLNQDAKDDYEIRYSKHNKSELSKIYDDKNNPKKASDYKKLQYLLNTNEKKVIDRRVTENYLNGDKAVSRISASLDINEFLITNNLDNLTSVDLAKLYFEEGHAEKIGVDKKTLKSFKNKLNDVLGYETTINGQKRKVALDSTIRNSIFAYDNVKEQQTYYSNLIKYSYDKNGLAFNSKKSWSENFEKLSKSQKGGMLNTYEYALDESNKYIASTLKITSDKQTRNILINGRNRTENTSYYKNTYDFKLNDGFYEDKKSSKIKNLRKARSDEQLVTFDLDRENPRANFMQNLLKEKFVNTNRFSEQEMTKLKQATFLDFIKSVSDTHEYELFYTNEFQDILYNIQENESGFSLEDNLELLQQAVIAAKDKNIDAGIKRNATVASSHVNKNIAASRNKLSMEEIKEIGKNAPVFDNLNGSKKKIDKKIDYLLNNFFMPNKEDFLSGSYKTKKELRGNEILYDKVRKQMKGALSEVFEAAGIAQAYIHYDITEGVLSIVKNDESIALDDFPVIMQQQGTLYATSNGHPLALKHVIDTSGDDIISRTNLDLNFGKEGVLSNRVQKAMDNDTFSLDWFKREVGYTKIGFSDSPSITNFTLADFRTSNNTADIRPADKIFNHIFNADGKFKDVLIDLYRKDELNTPNIIRILEDMIKDTPLKDGELSAVVRMLSNADVATILRRFAKDEDTDFLLANMNSLGKETRIAEGNRYIGNNIFPTLPNAADNYGKPTMVSAQNSRWIKSNTVEHTKKNYEGLLISGPVINAKDIMDNIYIHVEETGMNYQNSISHRQLYTGVLGINEILNKEEERVFNAFGYYDMAEKEAEEFKKLYNKASLKIRDRVFEQAKVLDPLLFEGVYGQIAQDTKVIGNGLEAIEALNKIKHSYGGSEKILKDTKLEQMLDTLGQVSVDENGVINYKKGYGTIVKRGERVLPYKGYGGNIEYVSGPFATGNLGFAIRDAFGNELSEKEINKILNDNLGHQSFSDDPYGNLINVLSYFENNKSYKMAYEIENVNKVEAGKLFDNYSEKSMASLFYAKTGEFDEDIANYFKVTSGNRFTYHTVLTDKSIDSYTADMVRKHGEEKAMEILTQNGFASAQELKERIQKEQFKYRELIFGTNGILPNVSGIANDDLPGHKNQGSRISSIMGQAISLVGKNETGLDNAEGFEIGLQKVLSLINDGNGKYDFITETTDGNVSKPKRQKYTKNEFALLLESGQAEDNNSFIFDIEKAQALLKDIDSTFLKNAPDEDRLYHKNIKVYTGEDKYETIDEYFGSLSFYENEKGEKIVTGSYGVVSKNYSIDSEFQSNLSKEYLDRKKTIVSLGDEIKSLEAKELMEDDKEKLGNIRDEIQSLKDKRHREISIVDSMKDYSKHMKIDDQARNILANSELNETTEKTLTNIISGKNREHYSNLLNDSSNGLIRDDGEKVVISGLIKSDNVNKKLLDEIKSQITYNPLEEEKITPKMIKSNEYSKYKSIYDRVHSMDMELGVDHAKLFYEAIQTNKAAEFNMSNSVTKDTLINDYDFKHTKIEDYVSPRGRADNAVLSSIAQDALLIDLGEEFEDNRFVAVPALGKKSGDKAINQEWQKTLTHLSKTYKEYQDLEGVDNDQAAKLRKNIIDMTDQIKVQTNEFIKKDQVIANLAKVEVNMPYSRVKLMSTMSEELIQSPLTEEMKRNNTLISNIDSESFRKKAMINGKTIAEWEKGGVDGGGMFFDYRTAGEAEFENAGYFNKKFLKETMGFTDYVDENGKTIDATEQMRRYLETNGTMDIVDRYPNIKDTSLYTGMVFLDRTIEDNVTAVAGHSLLKLNGDSDGDMLSTLFLDYKGTNFATYNKFRTDAEEHVSKRLLLSDGNMSPEDLEKEIKREAITMSKGRVSSDAYDLFLGKQNELLVNAVENIKIIEENLLPKFYKDNERNYKNMGLAITKDGSTTLLEAEVAGGKSILGKIKLFNQDEHVSSGFFVKNDKEISGYMEQAYKIFEDSGLIKNKDDYKYIQQMSDKTHIQEFNTDQSEALDEMLSVFDIAKKSEDLLSSREYDKIEKSVTSRIRANTYIQAEISKSGKESIGQINAALYPLRQASEELYGRHSVKDEINEYYNPLARQVVSDMSEQIEQNIISYKKVEAVAGDERLVDFIDIMHEVKMKKSFNPLSGETTDKLTEWNKKYLKSDVIENMYSNLEYKDLLTPSMITSQTNNYNKMIEEGISHTEASASSKIMVLTEQYANSITGLYQNPAGQANINLFSNYGRRSGKVTSRGDTTYASGDSHAGVIESIVTESPVGKAPPHKYSLNDLDDLKKDIRLSSSDTGKAIATKVIQDTADIFDSANSMGIALGVIGLASGLLVSGFASGNPLKNPQQEQTEMSPKTQAMSVPDFFESQGGYVTGNSQNGYILNIKADTKKGQKHMKRALKQAVTSSTGGAVSINMNFKSNNSGGYSDQDIEKLINSYI